VGLLLEVVLGDRVRAPAWFPGSGQAQVGLSVIPSLRGAAWSAAAGAVGRGQSDGATSPGGS
jgi:hypothetical protein